MIEKRIKRDLVSYLQSHSEAQIIDIQIQAGVRDRLPCRLIAVHLNREQRRIKARETVYQPASKKGVQVCGPKKGKKEEKKRKKSRQKCKRTSKSRLQLADWIFLRHASCQRTDGVAQEALVLMRCRWQIELLWKRMTNNMAKSIRGEARSQIALKRKSMPKFLPCF